ncbi:nuclease-related domain-containing protein [Psychrobacillus psychrodurans]|uniref:NERD domain-containing protein n=1 Tax=Psychrobacillus psychrodurans TaxID=126157 RepID=A0A9X3RA71_9BACI|nr:nuclease-related domain-containing protein [Psychrobacillus psychrodurans]MCZ8534210.1 NERD domain-containing protein [Psychrobacillus psychrodurans]
MFKNIIRRVEDLLSPSAASKTADKPKQKSVISTYKEQTGNGLFSTMFNKGQYGEFSSYGKLAKLPGYHKALFNIYIPNGKQQTTEIDLVYLHETGIESKNYSGWIFGGEKSQKWMQTFPNGQKFSFYNPIKQNMGHIKALKGLLPSIETAQFKSVIVFSERCELKKVTYEAKDTYVIKRNLLSNLMVQQIHDSPNIFEAAYIDKIYNFLSQYQKVDKSVKEQHIEKTKGKYSR